MEGTPYTGGVEPLPKQMGTPYTGGVSPYSGAAQGMDRAMQLATPSLAVQALLQKYFGKEQPMSQMTTGEAVASSFPVRALAGATLDPAAAMANFNVGEGGIAEDIKGLRQAYTDVKERGMTARGQDTTDYAGMAGQMIPAVKAANLAATTTKAAPFMEKVVEGMRQGAIGGGLIPGNDMAEQAFNVAGGGTIGGVLRLGGAGAGALGEWWNKNVTAPGVLMEWSKKNIPEPFRQSVIKALVDAKGLLPGTKPTAAEAVAYEPGGTSIKSLQKIISETPGVSPEFETRTVLQREARQKALDALAKTPDDLAEAIKQRTLATVPLAKQVEQSVAVTDVRPTLRLLKRWEKLNPANKELMSGIKDVRGSLYEPYPLTARGKAAWGTLNEALQSKPWGVNDTEVLGQARTILNRVKTGKIGKDEALTELRVLKAATSDVKDLLKQTAKELRLPDAKLRTSPQSLKSASDHVKNLLDKTSTEGVPVNKAIAKELTQLKNSIAAQIAKAEPAFGQFKKEFVEKSVPINKMQVAKELEGRLTNPIGEPTPKRFVSALDDTEAEKKLIKDATGYGRSPGLSAIYTPDEREVIGKTKADVLRDWYSTHPIQKTQLQKATNMAPGMVEDVLPAVLTPKVTIPKWLLRSVASRKVEPELDKMLSEYLLNPQSYGRFLQAPVPESAFFQRAQMLDALMKRYAPAAATAATSSVQP